MTFGNYIYQDGTSQSRQNAINQIINTADKLEAGHLKAVEAASQLQSAIANLDMNEAEDGFKQQLLGELQATIDENVKFGNMYYALDDIIKKSGDLMSNPQVIGKLRAQQAYKAFQDNLDKRTDVPEYMKPMFKALNPYKYNDVVDDKGNIIGGTKWTPTISPVSYIDDTKIFEQALKLIKPDVNSSYGNYSFVDANGNKIDPLKNGATTSGIQFLNHATGSTVKLERDHIAKSLLGLYKHNQAIQKHVEQEMLFSEYNNPNVDTNTELYYQIGDKKGKKKSPEDYFIDKYGNSLVASAFKQTAYDNNWTPFVSGNGNNGSGNGSPVTAGNGIVPEVTTAGTITVTRNTYQENNETYGKAINGIQGALDGLLVLQTDSVLNSQ